LAINGSRSSGSSNFYIYFKEDKNPIESFLMFYGISGSKVSRVLLR